MNHLHFFLHFIIVKIIYNNINVHLRPHFFLSLMEFYTKKEKVSVASASMLACHHRAWGGRGRRWGCLRRMCLESGMCASVPALFQLQEHFHCQALIRSDFQPLCPCPCVHRESPLKHKAGMSEASEE